MLELFFIVHNQSVQSNGRISLPFYCYKSWQVLCIPYRSIVQSAMLADLNTYCNHVWYIHQTMFINVLCIFKLCNKIFTTSEFACILPSFNYDQANVIFDPTLQNIIRLYIPWVAWTISSCPSIFSPQRRKWNYHIYWKL